jgi:glucose-1-phosphate thymidylyltransferase
MKAVVLAAGYATRLYPLTLDRPKALLPVGGRPMLEHLLDRLDEVSGLGDVYVVTNSKFAGVVGDWAATSGRGVRIFDDGTTTEETRLGAIGDLELAIRSEAIDEDLLVLAGDNLFSESFAAFADFGREKGSPALGVYDVGDLERVRGRYNAIEVDGDDRVVFFEEKPERPTSTLTGIALYFYPRSSLGLVSRYLGEGNNPDQPGRLVEWLHPRTPVYAWRVPGRWYDVGSRETLAEADRAFSVSD